MERVSASPPRAILLFLWSGGVSIRILDNVTGARTSASPRPGCSHLGRRSSGVSRELGGPRSVAAPTISRDLTLAQSAWSGESAHNTGISRVYTLFIFLHNGIFEILMMFPPWPEWRGTPRVCTSTASARPRRACAGCCSRSPRARGPPPSPSPGSSPPATSTRTGGPSTGRCSPQLALALVVTECFQDRDQQPEQGAAEDRRGGRRPVSEHRVGEGSDR